MKAVMTAEAIRESEAATMKTVSESVLVTRAATAVHKEITARFSPCKVAVFCGGGGNGADGYTLAKLLFKSGYDVTAIKCCASARAQQYCESAIDEGVTVVDKYDGAPKVVVDALFGIGCNRIVTGDMANWIATVNELKKGGAYVVSCDIPSGLIADTGEGVCVNANLTVTFTALKPALLLNGGLDCCGDIVVADVGIGVRADAHLVEECDARLPSRPRNSHKGTYGRVKIIGGSDTMVGAPLISYTAAVAASRGGAGLVTLCVPTCAKAAYQMRVKEQMLCYLKDNGETLVYDEDGLKKILNASAIAFGMGVGCGEAKKIVNYLNREFDGVLILDADALNSIDKDFVAERAKVILTPHVGEFKRLFGEPPTIESVKRRAKMSKCIIVAKSASTIISDGNEVFISTSGCAAMAKGGSGDALCGVIAAHSCIFEPLKAAYSACYRFGKAGERAAEKRNDYSVLASDIVEEL